MGQVVSSLIVSPSPGVNMWGDRREAKGPRELQQPVVDLGFLNTGQNSSRNRVSGGMAIKTSTELVCIKKKAEEKSECGEYEISVLLWLNEIPGMGEFQTGTLGVQCVLGVNRYPMVRMCVWMTVCYQRGINYI